MKKETLKPNILEIKKKTTRKKSRITADTLFDLMFHYESWMLFFLSFVAKLLWRCCLLHMLAMLTSSEFPGEKVCNFLMPKLLTAFFEVL